MHTRVNGPACGRSDAEALARIYAEWVNAELHTLGAQMTLGGPATSEAVAQAEVALGMKLPPEYVAFMLDFNGGEGAVGESWARFCQSKNSPR